MNGRYVRLFLTVLLLLAVASPTFAARRSSLSGNLLIQDADDMFFFPQLVTMHNRMVTFDFGTNAGLGSGGMVFGNEQVTVGLFAHRSEFLGTIDQAFFTRGDIDNVGNAGAIGVGVGPDALNWIDLLLGFQAGENPVGVRLSLARGNNDPPDPAAGETKADVTGFNIVLGTRLASRGIDGSIEFGYASAKDNVAGAKDEMSPWQVALAVRRTAIDESDALFLGWLGMFSYGSATEDLTPVTGTGSSTDNSHMNVQIGVGPVYHPNERTNVAMYGTFDYIYDKMDPGSAGTKETFTSMGIPGWNVAAEVEVTSWLQFRSGLRSRFEFANDKIEPPSPAASSETKTNGLSYDWTTGIGLHAGNFSFDGYLNPDVITTGTDFFGNSSRLFGLVTTTLTF
jgi:hypothetical protein